LMSRVTARLAAIPGGTAVAAGSPGTSPGPAERP
jgi:hypothetical protein